MAGGFLHIFSWAPFSSAVMVKVARIECADYPRSSPRPATKLAHYAVDGIRIHRAAFVLAFAVGTQRPE
jgi:hypothetical protein